MSVYNFLPSADVAGKECSNSWWDNGFSQDEIAQICAVGDSKQLTDAVVGVAGPTVEESIRRSRVSWFKYDDLPWLYDKLGYIARQLNGQYFQADISGFYEDLQYTVYQSTNTGHYDWHVDKGFDPNGAPPRKLSMVLMLSSPDEYSGGDLELQVGNGITAVQKTQGIVHMFPSYVLHRVTPVTAGTRKSLVAWLCGPRWK